MKNLSENQNNEEKETELSVKGMKALLDRIMELEAERDDYKGKLELIAEKAFEKRRNKAISQGADASEITDIESLKSWEDTHKPKGAGIGTVSLSPEQTEPDFSGYGYDSYAEMFADIHKQLHHGNKQEQKHAKDLLGHLSVKALKALKTKNQELDIKIPSDEQIKHGITTVDLLNSWWRRTQKKED